MSEGWNCFMLLKHLSTADEQKAVFYFKLFAYLLHIPLSGFPGEIKVKTDERTL